MTISRKDLVRLSGEVAERTSLVDLRLRKIESEVLTPLVKEPLKIALTTFDRAVSRVPHHAVYNFTYGIEGVGDNNEKVFRASIVLSLIFRFTDDFAPSSPALRAFGAVGVVDIAHPYVRELVHSLSWRMGLPPLVLEVSAPVE
ncbi:hypothetical protein AB0C29_01480 [Actinoplanes sp. NPDC048791]|uniref:hypothetical protein n=1 Tax=Actinoplanes sp. NPDC048791 TaxID=3154623 RepID=UPI0033E57FC5